MSKKALTILIVIIVVIIGATIIVKKKKEIENLKPPSVSATIVNTARAREGSVDAQIETLALIKADKSSTISAQVSGNVIKMFFNEGNVVKKGQAMAIIDPTIYEDSLESAKAKSEAAKREFDKQEAIYNRDKVLYENGAISKQNFEISEAQFENAKANYISAEKAMNSAKTKRSYCDVKAPYSCVVTAKLAEEGDLASAGKPIYEVEIPGSVKVISKLSQDTLKRLKEGDKVVFSYEGKYLEAKITRIYPSLDNLHLGTVETELEKSPFNLPSGATINASYFSSKQSGIVVPSNSVLKTADGALILKVENGKSSPVKVEIAAEGKEETAVKGEINPGDEVIVGMQSELLSLSAGCEVAPLRREK